MCPKACPPSQWASESPALVLWAFNLLYLSDIWDSEWNGGPVGSSESDGLESAHRCRWQIGLKPAHSSLGHLRAPRWFSHIKYGFIYEMTSLIISLGATWRSWPRFVGSPSCLACFGCPLRIPDWSHLQSSVLCSYIFAYGDDTDRIWRDTRPTTINCCEIKVLSRNRQVIHSFIHSRQVLIAPPPCLASVLFLPLLSFASIWEVVGMMTGSQSPCCFLLLRLV